MYDTLQGNHCSIHEINLTEDHGKSCHLFYQKYKTEMESIANENAQKEKNIRQKLKMDKIETVEKKKLNVKSCMDNLKEGIINEMLAVSQNKDLIKYQARVI